MIPLSQPFFEGSEWNYVKACIDSTWVSSSGQYVNTFAQQMAHYTGATYAIPLQSGTSALHLMLVTCGLMQDEYVIMPDLTFVAGGNAVSYLGAKPILIDIDPNTWQMNVSLLTQFLNEECTVIEDRCIYKKDGKRIRVLMTVHILGFIAQIEALKRLANEFHLLLIEDAAAALGSWYKKKHAGTWGEMGCISFNGNKIITTGGGGMVLTEKKEYADRLLHLSQQAKITGEQYWHDEVGYNYRMNNISAALGLAQIEQLPYILERRQEIATLYQEQLTPFSSSVEFPNLDENLSPNFWLNTIKVKDKKRMIAYLREHQIQSRSIYTPLHLLPMFKECKFISESDFSGKLFSNAVSLPTYTTLSEAELSYIVERIREVL